MEQVMSLTNRFNLLTASISIPGAHWTDQWDYMVDNYPHYIKWIVNGGEPPVELRGEKLCE